jgi:hypothetical protein|tara:strand:- start:95 stop:328 length:234 start_codon:yes stop_codon:yes gene_type:complete
MQALRARRLKIAKEKGMAGREGFEEEKEEVASVGVKRTIPISSSSSASGQEKDKDKEKNKGEDKEKRGSPVKKKVKN